MDDSTTKRCTKCGAEKPSTDFTISKIHRDGRYPSCKACKSVQAKAYKAANPERVRAQKRSNAAKHAEKHRADGKKRYAANRDQVIARTTAYKKTHPEVGRKSKQKWIAAHRDRHLADTRQRSAEWREQNRDKDRAASVRWQKANPSAYRAIQHKRRSRVRGAEGSYTAQEWDALKARYNHRCLCCGKAEPEILLTVDHVIPVGPIGPNDISNIQPLCGPCNNRKGNRRSTDYRLSPHPSCLLP